MRDPLGLESKTVRLVPYDERWVSSFADEAARILHAVASATLPPLMLEHVGSTAIPGLVAKPILDIAAAYPRGTAAATYIGPLESLGYVYRGNGGLPGREFFRRGAPRTHHLHLVEHDGTHWRRYLRFRDALRGDSTLRDEYAALKRALAERYPRDRDAYIEGKSDFVEAVLRREARPAPDGR